MTIRNGTTTDWSQYSSGAGGNSIVIPRTEIVFTMTGCFLPLCTLEFAGLIFLLYYFVPVRIEAKRISRFQIRISKDLI